MCHTKDQPNLIPIFLGWKYYSLFGLESPPAAFFIFSILGNKLQRLLILTMTLVR